MRPQPVIAIVGAGFSGSLLALHLLETGPPGAVILLIERAQRFGPGLAYSTGNPRHLLNVRVGNMSAWPDRPQHLQNWLATEAGAAIDPSDFITRGSYGRYIASMIQAAVARPDGAARLILVHDEAVSLLKHGDGFDVTLAMGRVVKVNAVVLATGNAPPGGLRGIGLEDLPDTAYAPDPWEPSALEGLSETSSVLLLGTGLTMVDFAIAMETRGHRGPVVAMSRRGLLPRRHEGFHHIDDDPPKLPIGDLSGCVRFVRARARTVGWRQAVDELRPVSQSVWLDADIPQRRRFLRHLRPWWDVHRHRMAPSVADQIEAMRAQGRPTVVAGRVLGTEMDGDTVSVLWRRRNSALEETARIDRIVNCTGPGGDLSRSADSLLRNLLDTGVARPDDLGFGLDVDRHCRLIDVAGKTQPRLHAVGPITRGVFWEIVAAPDIRNQVAEVAAHVGRSLMATTTP